MSRPNRPVITVVVTALYLMLLLAATLYKYKKPAYNWDMIAYAASAISIEEDDPVAIHDIAYQEVSRQIPPASYKLLTDTAIHFRARMHRDADFFNSQLPFYVVKPLYIALVYLAHKAGATLASATFIPSVLSYFGIGLLLFCWLRRHLNVYFSAILGALLLLATPLVQTASLATPDCLSGFLLLCSFYFLIEKQKIGCAYAFMLAAIFTRLDNVLIAFVVLSAVTVGKKWPRPMLVRQYGWMILGLLAAYFLVALCAARYGWSIFFLPTFYARFHDTFYSVRTSSIIKDYILQRHSAVMLSFLIYHLSIYLSFALLLFVGNKSLRWKHLTFDQAFMLTLITTIAIRAVIYTDLGDRYFIAYFLVIPMLLVRRIKELLSGQSTALLLSAPPANERVKGEAEAYDR